MSNYAVVKNFKFRVKNNVVDDFVTLNNIFVKMDFVCNEMNAKNSFLVFTEYFVRFFGFLKDKTDFSKISNLYKNNQTIFVNNSNKHDDSENAEAAKINNSNKTSLLTVDLNKRIINCLNKIGVFYLEQLCDYSFDQIKNLNNLGKISLNKLIEAMKKYGVSFKI